MLWAGVICFQYSLSKTFRFNRKFINTETKTHTGTEKQTKKKIDRETERQIESQRETDIDRETDRQRQRKRERDYTQPRDITRCYLSVCLSNVPVPNTLYFHHSDWFRIVCDC